MTASDSLHVVFRVGTADYVLPASIVAELDSFTAATSVPGTQPHVVGLVHVRGRVVPLAGFSWGFTIDSSGDIALQDVQALTAPDWDGHLPYLGSSHPGWQFEKWLHQPQPESA